MNFELGVYSFGNTPRTADGGYRPTAQAIRDVLQAVHVAEEVGLDFFGFGAHHTQSMPLSSPTALVNAAAASTRHIGLGTTVSVLSTDDPIRVFQQLASAAALAPGRIDVVAGRGSFPITFPLFDLDENDYDVLYESKLELLIALNPNHADLADTAASQNARPERAVDTAEQAQTTLPRSLAHPTPHGPRAGTDCPIARRRAPTGSPVRGFTRPTSESGHPTDRRIWSASARRSVRGPARFCAPTANAS